jgi:hypothetical protein
MAEIKFGYWPCKRELSAGVAQVRPLSDYDGTVQGISGSGRIANKWLYPPLTRAYDPKLAPDKQPEIYESVYRIKATHVLTLPDATDATKCGEFLIALLGMLEGLRLIPEEWGHFYRMAIERHTLCDLVCDRRDLEQVLEMALQFWRKSDTDVQRLIFGAIHWRLFSESYPHHFERFNGQYIVLDTCYRLHCRIFGKPSSNDGLHATRPSFLAREHKVPVPSWAVIGPDRTCDLSRLRNKFFHEGLYGGQPIGFAYPTFATSIDFELAAFNTRLILALLGVPCSYVRSDVATRSMHGLGLHQ